MKCYNSDNLVYFCKQGFETFTIGPLQICVAIEGKTTKFVSGCSGGTLST